VRNEHPNDLAHLRPHDPSSRGRSSGRARPAVSDG
jgi:hypothetical protein